jgi:NADP-dependent 3-hydroxy acid dehydrogenase YdfG
VNPTYDFTGQVALVTGASSGMGLATAQAFAQAGAAVVLADINDDALRAATEDLVGSGHQALGVTCDVSDEAQVAAMVDRTVAAYGRLDMAFNNAGIQIPPSDAADEPAEAFDRVNAINLRGVWACVKHELCQMCAQGSGAIVNCSSLGGLVGLPGRGAYHASKHGVIGLTRSTALEYTARHPHQRDLPRDDRDPDGQRHDLQGRARRRRGDEEPADRPTRPGRRDRRGRPLALQPGRQPRPRRRTPRGRRLHHPMTRGQALADDAVAAVDNATVRKQPA